MATINLTIKIDLSSLTEDNLRRIIGASINRISEREITEFLDAKTIKAGSIFNGKRPAPKGYKDERLFATREEFGSLSIADYVTTRRKMAHFWVREHKSEEQGIFRYYLSNVDGTTWYQMGFDRIFSGEAPPTIGTQAQGGDDSSWAEFIPPPLKPCNFHDQTSYNPRSTWYDSNASHTSYTYHSRSENQTRNSPLIASPVWKKTFDIGLVNHLAGQTLGFLTAERFIARKKECTGGAEVHVLPLVDDIAVVLVNAAGAVCHQYKDYVRFSGYQGSALNYNQRHYRSEVTISSIDYNKDNINYEINWTLSDSSWIGTTSTATKDNSVASNDDLKIFMGTRIQSKTSPAKLVLGDIEWTDATASVLKSPSLSYSDVNYTITNGPPLSFQKSDGRFWNDIATLPVTRVSIGSSESFTSDPLLDLTVASAGQYSFNNLGRAYYNTIVSPVNSGSKSFYLLDDTFSVVGDPITVTQTAPLRFEQLESGCGCINLSSCGNFINFATSKTISFTGGCSIDVTNVGVGSLVRFGYGLECGCNNYSYSTCADSGSLRVPWEDQSASPSETILPNFGGNGPVGSTNYMIVDAASSSSLSGYEDLISTVPASGNFDWLLDANVSATGPDLSTELTCYETCDPFGENCSSPQSSNRAVAVDNMGTKNKIQPTISGTSLPTGDYTWHHLAKTGSLWTALGPSDLVIYTAEKFEFEIVNLQAVARYISNGTQRIEQPPSQDTFLFKAGQGGAHIGQLDMVLSLPLGSDDWDGTFLDYGHCVTIELCMSQNFETQAEFTTGLKYDVELNGPVNSGQKRRWSKEGYDHTVLATIRRDSSGRNDLDALYGTDLQLSGYTSDKYEYPGDYSNPYVGQITVGSGIVFGEDPDTGDQFIENFPGWPATESGDFAFADGWADPYWNFPEGASLTGGYVHIYEPTGRLDNENVGDLDPSTVHCPNWGIYKIASYPGPGGKIVFDSSFNRFARTYKVDEETPAGYDRMFYKYIGKSLSYTQGSQTLGINGIGKMPMPFTDLYDKQTIVSGDSLGYRKCESAPRSYFINAFIPEGWTLFARVKEYEYNSLPLVAADLPFTNQSMPGLYNSSDLNAYSYEDGDLFGWDPQSGGLPIDKGNGNVETFFGNHNTPSVGLTIWANPNDFKGANGGQDVSLDPYFVGSSINFIQRKDKVLRGGSQDWLTAHTYENDEDLYRAFVVSNRTVAEIEVPDGVKGSGFRDARFNKLELDGEYGPYPEETIKDFTVTPPASNVTSDPAFAAGLFYAFTRDNLDTSRTSVEYILGSDSDEVFGRERRDFSGFPYDKLSYGDTTEYPTLYIKNSGLSGDLPWERTPDRSNTVQYLSDPNNGAFSGQGYPLTDGANLIFKGVKGPFLGALGSTRMFPLNTQPDVWDPRAADPNSELNSHFSFLQTKPMFMAHGDFRAGMVYGRKYVFRVWLAVLNSFQAKDKYPDTSYPRREVDENTQSLVEQGTLGYFNRYVDKCLQDSSYTPVISIHLVDLSEGLTNYKIVSTRRYETVFNDMRIFEFEFTYNGQYAFQIDNYDGMFLFNQYMKIQGMQITEAGIQGRTLKRTALSQGTNGGKFYHNADTSGFISPDLWIPCRKDFGLSFSQPEKLDFCLGINNEPFEFYDGTTSAGIIHLLADECFGPAGYADPDEVFEDPGSARCLTDTPYGDVKFAVSRNNFQAARNDYYSTAEFIDEDEDQIVGYKDSLSSLAMEAIESVREDATKKANKEDQCELRKGSLIDDITYTLGCERDENLRSYRFDYREILDDQDTGTNKDKSAIRAGDACGKSFRYKSSYDVDLDDTDFEAERDCPEYENPESLLCQLFKDKLEAMIDWLQKSDYNELLGRGAKKNVPRLVSFSAGNPEKDNVLLVNSEKLSSLGFDVELILAIGTGTTTDNENEDPYAEF